MLRSAKTGSFCALQGQEVTDCHNQRGMTWIAAWRSSLYASSRQRTDNRPNLSREEYQQGDAA